MQQMELAAKLDALENKTLRLVAYCEELKKQLAAAEKEKVNLEETIQKQAVQIRSLSKKQESQQNNFNNPLKISKIVSLISADSSETAELKARIDEYIQELNKCIAHLSQS
jgi:predicted nuclease with TOPRIM domain